MIKVLRLLLPLTFLVACKGKGFKAKSESNPDLVSYSLKMDMDESAQPSADLKQLIADINSGKPVSFSRITRQLMEKHAKASSQATSDQIAQFVNRITPKNITSLNGRQTKQSYEAAIGGDLIYNRDKSNVTDIMLEKKMQCYSGTYLYQLVTRQAGAPAFRARNEVVIFEKGHVRPGYFQFFKNSKVLVGIETTQAGPAGEWISSLGNGNTSLGSRCVVDAELYAIVELAQNYLKNKSEVVKQAYAQTAKKYGFEVDPVCQPEVSHSSTAQLLNSSVFGFGVADVPAGDQPRTASSDDGKPFAEPVFKTALGRRERRVEMPLNSNSVIVKIEGTNQFYSVSGDHAAALRCMKEPKQKCGVSLSGTLNLLSELEYRPRLNDAKIQPLRGCHEFDQGISCDRYKFQIVQENLGVGKFDMYIQRIQWRKLIDRTTEHATELEYFVSRSYKNTLIQELPTQAPPQAPMQIEDSPAEKVN
jgi:hypothetical protein